MAGSDVLALTSVRTERGSREGVPVVLMEAMATGLPVVASDLSGIPELVEHEQNGLLVPPGDADSIAQALDRLRRDPDLRPRLGQAARRKVAREFNLHRTVDRLMLLWQQAGAHLR
jgi:glycosyltransferase involved in cell wall biosynthesis